MPGSICITVASFAILTIKKSALPTTKKRVDSDSSTLARKTQTIISAWFATVRQAACVESNPSVSQPGSCAVCCDSNRRQQLRDFWRELEREELELLEQWNSCMEGVAEARRYDAGRTGALDGIVDRFMLHLQFLTTRLVVLRSRRPFPIEEEADPTQAIRQLALSPEPQLGKRQRARSGSRRNP